VAGRCNASQDTEDAWDAGDASLASGRNAEGSDAGSVLLILRSSTFQTTAYTEPEMEADGQGHMEPIRLIGDSSDEYERSHLGDETEPDTEPKRANLGGPDETTRRRHRGPRLVETHGNHRRRIVRISTNSGLQEAVIVLETPVALVTITPGRPLSPATFPSSSVARYSSLLGVPRTKTSGIRSSCPPGAPSTRGTVSVRYVMNSRRHTVTGVEGEILGVAKDLILQYNL